MAQQTYTIYCIENTTNNKFYVGVTIDISKRKHDHFKKLRIGKHNNSHLQNSWNKHGEDSFKFREIEENIETESEASHSECFWIDILQTMYYQDGYNIQYGGYNGNVSLESKRKIIKTTTKKQGKKVAQYNLSGELINIFDSISKASRETGFEIGSISGCCNKKKHYNTAGGYQWRFLSENRLSINSVKKEISKYDFNGKLLETYNTIIEASNKNNISYSSIASCLKGNQDRAGDFMWEEGNKKRINEFNGKRRAVGQFLKNGTLVSAYKSLSDASRTLKILTSGIYACCSGRQQTSYGYIWRYL